MYELNEGVAQKVLTAVDAGLVRGMGSPIPGQMCVEAAVCFAFGLPHSDKPPCVGNAVRAIKIRLNDSNWSSNEARAKGMRRVAIAQLGSDTLDQHDFVKRFATEIIKQIVPIALRAAGSLKGNAKHKDALEAAAKRCETEGTRDAALSGKKAAAAAYAADAAAYAAYAADAAAAAAYAAAYAAADAAYADAYAAYADAERSRVRDEILSKVAEIVVKILQDMKSPGCAWLGLTEES